MNLKDIVVLTVIVTVLLASIFLVDLILYPTKFTNPLGISYYPLKKVWPVGHKDDIEDHIKILVEVTFFNQKKNRKSTPRKLSLPTFEGDESSTSPISQENILTYSKLRGLQYPSWHTEEDIELFFKSLKRTASVLSRGWKSCGLFSYFLESSGEGIIFELQDSTIKYGGLLHATNNKIYLYSPSEGVVLYDCKNFKQIWTGSYFYASKNRF